ncbi:MAG: SprT-like domain-containing protein, partial [Desulfobacterales bacterium]
MPDLKKRRRSKLSETLVQQDLERSLLHGIACEWESAWLGLDPDKQQLLRKPTFAIKDMKNQWGNWSAEKRQIAISRHLVHDYGWDSVRDVLLHEMAHQIAHEMFCASTQTPHGPAFQQACELLRIHPTASADYLPLSDRLMNDHFSVYDKRMLRIKKLLALAESKNRFEA